MNSVVLCHIEAREVFRYDAFNSRNPRRMKFLFDFFPVLAFFVAFYIPKDHEQGIYLATAVAIAATFIQVLQLHFAVFPPKK